MSNIKQVHPSVKIDNLLLKKDRKLMGFTQTSFQAACDSVSLSTIRRAEQGHRVIEVSLQRMAEVLGRPPERYIDTQPLSDKGKHFVSLAGEWSGFYIEANQGALPRVITNDISIRQEGPYIEGELVSNTLAEVHTEKFVDCKIVGNVLSGFLLALGIALPAGMSSFTQLASRNNDWLEGFAVWLDSNSEQVENTRFIAVRKNSRHYARFYEEARFKIGRDLPMFSLRKLIEAGYSVSESFTMLTSIEKHTKYDAQPAELERTEHFFNVEGVEFLARENLSFGGFLDRLIAMDFKNIGYSGDVYEGTNEQWAPIFRRYPDSWRVLTKGKQIMGYWQCHALPPDTMAQVKDGKYYDSALTLDKIEPMSQPGTYSIYIVAVVVAPEARFGRPFKMLFDSFFTTFEKLATQSIFIDEVVVAAWSPESEKLANILGFSKISAIKSDNADVPIYAIKFADLLTNEHVDAFAGLRQLYQKQ